MGRAILLIAIAVVLGILVLRRANGATRLASAAPTTTTTVRPAAAAGAPTTAPPTTAAPRPPAEVKVLVANGSGVTGLAEQISTRLRTAGYNTLSATNASQRVASSVVYYGAGYQREAAALAQTLGLPPTSVQPMPTPPPVGSLGTANVLVVAGPDLAQGSTTTTVPTTAHTSTTLHTTTTLPTATTLHVTTTVKP